LNLKYLYITLQILLSSHEAEFEALMKNEVAQLNDHMTALESKLTIYVEQMETVHDDNITNIDNQMLQEVEAMNELCFALRDKVWNFY